MVAAMRKQSVAKIDPEIMGGTPCFAGTRVPVRVSIDCIQAGGILDDFVEGFPTVNHGSIPRQPAT